MIEKLIFFDGKNVPGTNALGIDLGTTNSTVACARLDRAEEVCLSCIEIDQQTLEGVYTNTIVPSVVALYRDKLFVGEGAKRLRARPLDFGLEYLRNIFWETKNHMGLARTYHKAAMGFRAAREIAGQLLKFLKEESEKEIDNIHSVVVTVPASFQAAQRSDTIAAARLAGLELTAGQLLDEPVAAFLDYLASIDSTDVLSLGVERKTLVFDFGGGTCDVALFSVMRPEQGERIRVAPISVSRYHRLGGGDIDKSILFDVLLPQLIEQNGLDPHQLTYEDKTECILPAYLGIAEALKIGLCKEILHRRAFGSVVPESEIDSLRKTQPGVHTCTLQDNRELRLQSPSLTGAQLRSVMEPFLDRDLLHARETEYKLTQSIFAPLEDVLDRGATACEEIDICLLVGGSTLHPFVQDAVNSYFQRAQILTFPTPEATQVAVARGAACQAFAIAVTGKGIVTPAAGDHLSILTKLGPVRLVEKGKELPYPADGSWAENRSLLVPITSMDEPVKLRIQLAGTDDQVLGAIAWELAPPVYQDDVLLLRYRLDENQILHVELSQDGRKDVPPFKGRFENPLTSVVNPSSKRSKIEELEERIRRGEVSKAELRGAIIEIADLYEDIGQYERAMALLKRVLRSSPDSSGWILNRLGMLCGQMGDYERQQKFYLEAAASGNNSGPLFNLALAHKRHGDIEKSMEAIDRAIQMDAEAPYLTLKASLLDTLGRKEESVELANRSLRAYDSIPTLDDWGLGWFITAAGMVRDDSRLAEAHAEKRKRCRSVGQVLDGELPGRASK